MCTTNGPTAHPENATPTESIAAKQAAFADAQCEPETAKTRQHLGLRPHVFNQYGPDGHPDRQPCPSWCWVGQSDDDREDHEVDPARPMSATHHMEGHPQVVAELYRGDSYGPSTRVTQAATIEPVFEQMGQEDPTIRVWLRHWPTHQEQEFNEVLHLSLTDAQELAVALNYLVGLEAAECR
jgi:hypothetical protein